LFQQLHFFLFAILPVANFEGWANFSRALASTVPVGWTIFTVIESLLWTIVCIAQGYLCFRLYNYINLKKRKGSSGMQDIQQKAKGSIKSTIMGGAMKIIGKLG